jgi:L-threonylcarbamoyladenylate synthase
MTSCLSCSLSELAARLQAGEAAILPTDTLPALASRPEAANLLWELKERPRHKPVILMGSDPEELFCLLGSVVEQAWKDLAKIHWPGALTLVLPARGTVLEQLHPGGTSLGLRVPQCRQALELLELSGPLATTSANRSGEAPCLEAITAARSFPGVALLAPVPWPAAAGVASTVLAWSDAGAWRVLRSGAVMPELPSTPAP